MELLETAYPEVIFDTHPDDARRFLRAVLDQYLERQGGLPPRPDINEQNELWLQSALATAPLLSFRCPLPLKEAQLRIRLPRRYPEIPLIATVEGTPQLTVPARKAVADSAADEAAKLCGELRGEPQCLQVLGEAVRAAADLVEESESAGGNNAPPAEAAACGQRSGGCCCGGGGDSEAPCGPHACATGGRRGSNATAKGARSGSTESVGGAVFLGRRLIYSHHIIATQKRTGIVKAARELGLGGFSKASVLFVCLWSRAVLTLAVVHT